MSDEVVVVDIDRSVIEVAFTETTRPLFATEDRGRSIEDRLAVVTGASGLLGAAIVEALVARGARVCLIGRDLDALRDTVARLDPSARTAMLRCDLAAADDVDAAADFIERIGQPVDLLVHAASLYAPSSITHGAVDDLDEHYLLDVRGPYLLTQRLLDLLAAAEGRVVFFAQGANGVTAPDVHRSISQAALGALAVVLREEAAARGIRVLTVRSDDDVDPSDSGDDTQEFLEVCAATVLDALATAALDVTELHVRRGNLRARSEQR